MEDQTFKSRLVELLSKSRKAVRLYDGVSKSKRGSAIAELQATEWLNVNTDLVTALSAILDDLSQKSLSAETSNILEQFTSRTLSTIESMHSKKRKLLSLAEEMDFSQASILSRELVGIKARVQALQAVNNELRSVLKKVKPQLDQSSQIELSNDDIFKPVKQKTPQIAKVIPLRQKVSLG